MKANEIKPQELRSLLRMDEERGLLYWRPRPIEMFQETRRWKTWNKRYAHNQCFKKVCRQGYLNGCIHGQRYLAHRVIWAMHYDAWPVHQIDHINGVRSDNRILNLRDVTRAENALNLRPSSKNTSGVTGVSWNALQQKWVAYISKGQTHKHLGTFDHFEDAVAARKRAERELGFHPNHGKVWRKTS